MEHELVFLQEIKRKSIEDIKMIKFITEFVESRNEIIFYLEQENLQYIEFDKKMNELQ